MIQASELRIGNKFLLGSKIETVYQILFDRKKGNCINTLDISTEDCFPIPLTPEILERCGFEKDEIFTWSHPYLKCRWVTGNLSGGKLKTPFLRFDSTGRPPFIKTDIYYLHQLQNYYFCQTEGQELQIKELQTTNE